MRDEREPDGTPLEDKSCGEAKPGIIERASLEDFVCAILDEAIEIRNADAAAQESERDLINDAYKK